MNKPKHHAPAMSFEQFVGSIERMVLKWQPEDPQAGATHRLALRAIYDEVRNSTAFQLATMQQQRDDAMATLHKHYVGYRGTQASGGTPP